MASIRDFGAKGDGVTDDSAAFRHAVEAGDGELLLPRGDYLLTRTVIVPLARLGRFAIRGGGGTARILWRGSGPALHLVGSHDRTADPTQFKEAVWHKERMPTVSDLEIVGTGEGDGVRLEGTMQGTLTGLLIRRCRHGIHLTKRNRNVIVADSHVYDNAGVGVFLDSVNLHQINIHGNHISYCKRGGIGVVDSEVRNIQVCSNDIEYNFDPKITDCSDIWFDARNGTVREGTIVGNTIQAKVSPGGANVRFIGPADNPNAVGMITISDNLIGSQETLLHLQSCRGIVASGNSMYGGERYAVRADSCEHLTFAGNSHDHNSDYKGNSTDLHRFHRCRNVNLTGLVVQHTSPPALAVESSIEIRGCDGVGMTGCQLVNARTRGVLVAGSSAVRVADCTIRGKPGDGAFRSAIKVDSASGPVMIVNNFLAKGTDADLDNQAGDRCHAAGNLPL